MPFTARFTELTTRAANGHSPSPEEIMALTAAPPTATAADLKQALPLIEKALANLDTLTYTLTAVASLEEAPPAPAVAAPDPDATPKPAPKPVAPAAVGPAAFKPDLARILAPDIPTFSAHLTDDALPNRILTAGILGGFTPNPPATVYPPLLAFLKRDDAIGPTGLAVVQDLLQLGPLSALTSAALSAFLLRSDQTADSRANLVDAVASAANQSQALNRTLVGLLDTDDPTLRARIILSLPALDLSPDTFADTKSRLATIAGNDQENLQVLTAAKAVLPCWTTSRMTAGCPVYQ